MITIDAEILEINHEQKIATVRPIHHAQCGICNHKECGALSITQLFSSHRQKNFHARLPITSMNLYQIGHKVSIEIEDSILWKSLFLGYLFPLIMLVIGAGIGNYFLGELQSIVGGLIGLIISIIILKLNQFKQNKLPIIKYHIL